MEHLAQPSIVEEDISEQEPDKLAVSELTLDNLKLTVEISLKLVVETSLKLSIKTSPKLAPYEQSQRGEVNLTQPPPQLGELILRETTLQTQHQ